MSGLHRSTMQDILETRKLLEPQRNVDLSPVKASALLALAYSCGVLSSLGFSAKDNCQLSQLSRLFQFGDLWNCGMSISFAKAVSTEINSKSELAIHLAVLFGEVKIGNPLLVETCKASFANEFQTCTEYD